MDVRRPQPAFHDARGTITDLVEGERIGAVSVVTTLAGSVRGNHWHAETVQYTYIASGRMRYSTQLPGGRREVREVVAGDLIVNSPSERHAMRAIDDTVFIVLTRGPRAGGNYESDTYRLGPNELLETIE